MKADQHSHNLQLAHSWIMVLATPRNTKPTATVHQNQHHYHSHHGPPPHPPHSPHHPNRSNQLLEPVSPFQEFTGYRLHNSHHNSSNNDNKYHKQQQPRRCISSDQLAALKAKHLFQHAALQDKVVAPPPHPIGQAERNCRLLDASYHQHKHAGGIPYEIVTVSDLVHHHVPSMIHVSQSDHPQDDDDDARNDDDANSEVTFEQDILEQQYQLRQLDPFGLNLNDNAALFPPLSKHHTQHDATWGITTLHLEGDDDDDDGDDDDNHNGIDLDDDDTMSDIDWPSDEDKSEDHRRAPPNLTMCAGATEDLFRHNMNCSGLQFWANGAVHQQNLYRKTTPTPTRTTTTASKHTAPACAPVRPSLAAATRDEEDTHERVENGSSRDTVLEAAWSSYEDFQFSRTRSYASRAPSRSQLL
jgi:hypothetical protein